MLPPFSLLVLLYPIEEKITKNNEGEIHLLTILIISIVIIFIVLLLSVLTVNKGYNYKHTVDLPPKEDDANSDETKQ